MDMMNKLSFLRKRTKEALKECPDGSGRLWPVQFLASQFWPIHFWPKLEVSGWWFGQFWPIQFGSIHFWPIHFFVLWLVLVWIVVGVGVGVSVCVVVCWCVFCCVFVVVSCGCLFVVVVRVGGVVVGLDHLAPDPLPGTLPPDPPSAGPSLRRTAQNFVLFLSLTVCLLVEFWWFL